jgi:MFS family permease
MKKAPGSKGPIFFLQISNFFSGVSNSVVMITIPWITLEVTDSPAFAGLVVALSAIPSLLVAPFGGVLIARFGSKAVSIFADLLSALAVVAFPLLSITGNLTGTTILLFALLGAIFDPLGYTARKTMIQATAEFGKFDLHRINGIHEGLLGSSWIIGPALGAWLIALVGASNSFWWVSAFFVVAALAITWIRGSVLPARAPQSSTKANHGSNLTLGFRRIWDDLFLRTLILAVLVIAAIYLPTESIILPTHFESINKPLDLGIVISALAAGSTISSFAYGWLVQRMSGKVLIRIAFIGASLGTLGMAFLPGFALMILFAVILGLSWGPFSPFLNSKIQARFPRNEHPMVFSAQTSVFYAAPPVGMLLVGFGVEAFGLSPTYLSLAVTMLIVSALALVSKPIRTES